MSHAFTAAVAAAIPGTVFVARAPADFVGSYKVLHPPMDTPQESDVALVTFAHSALNFVIVCVSNSVTGAQDLDDQVRTTLEGDTMLVDGRKYGPMRYTGLGVEVDESLLTPLYEARSMWSCMSVPA